MVWFIFKFFKWLYILILTFCLAMGLYYSYNQYIYISTSFPVPAKVISSDVESYIVHTKNGSRTAYVPKIKYRYIINKKHYTSDRYTLYNDEWTQYDSSWAQKIVNEYPKEKKITVYYPKDNPSEAFIIRRYSFFPYFFVMFSLFIFFLGSAGIFNFPKHIPPRAVEDGRFYELASISSLSNTKKFWHRIKSWILLIGLLALAHYYIVAEPPYSKLALFMLGLYGFFLFIVYYCRYYYSMKERQISDAKVYVSSPVAYLGQPLTVKILQDIAGGYRLGELKVGVVCKEIERQRTRGRSLTSERAIYEDWKSVLRNLETAMGKTLKGEAAFVLPVDGCPSIPLLYNPGSKFTTGEAVIDDAYWKKKESAKLPEGESKVPLEQIRQKTCQWYIVVKTTAEGLLPYEGSFPIEVALADS